MRLKVEYIWDRYADMGNRKNLSCLTSNLFNEICADPCKVYSVNILTLLMILFILSSLGREVLSQEINIVLFNAQFMKITKVRLLTSWVAYIIFASRTCTNQYSTTVIKSTGCTLILYTPTDLKVFTWIIRLRKNIWIIFWTQTLNYI